MNVSWPVAVVLLTGAGRDGSLCLGGRMLEGTGAQRACESRRPVRRAGVTALVDG